MRKTLSLFLLLAGSPGLWAANSITSVSQVTSAVTVSEDVDYVISSTTPFTNSGTVNITDTEHGVVIIENIKPSKVIQNWLRNHVYINGVQAVNGSNCQVKMYAQGAIILPYASNIKPLTVYSEQNFGGTSCNDFGLENTGGFMNTLSEEKLNNNIRSFKLKRGYMVTFSTRAGGRGYSRCFIADKEDLEVSTLPTVLDKTISSYRVFQWYNAAKKGLASNGDKTANQALNTSWCYDWAQGNANNLPDCEWVPNHIYEDWPSPSTCGGVTGSCHMKTNNEPANQSDDHPQSVETILANWENLMRTGMRLCTPSSWDGSDYWNGTGNVIKVFLDSIDARGWRCDIVDAHCYWPEGNFQHLENYWWPNYKRPIWISEWIWGASWNKNGAFGNGVTNSQIVSTTKNILNKLNSMGCVERYAYWNSESKGHIYENGQLTELGEYYASMKTGLGYNPTYEFIPRNPRMYGPSNLSAKYDKTTQQVTLSWHERNGEYNSSMEIQVRAVGSNGWKRLQYVDLQETEADYQVTVDALDGNRYRIRILDVNKTERLSNEAYAVNENQEYGDAVTVVENGETKTKYLGGNRLVNGDFLLGGYDWTNGAGAPLSAPYFQIVPKGGMNNSPYLQCYGNSSSNSNEQIIFKKLILKPNSFYYLGGACNQTNGEQRIMTGSLTSGLAASSCLTFQAVSEWAEQGLAYYVKQDTCLFIQLRNAAGKAQFDNFKVCPLFDSPEAAAADALEWERSRVEAFIDVYADQLKNNLLADWQSVTDANELEEKLLSCYAQILTDNAQALRASLTTEAERSLPFAADADHYKVVADKLQNPQFDGSSTGWTVKAGTYTGGDQRLATQAGQTCWNAWWSNAVSGSDNPTLSIKQTTKTLSHGLYALECKATTQHLCETDQHGWLYNAETGETIQTEPISLGNLDLPNFSEADKWQTLTTSYTYVQEGATLEVGFTGSKTAADNGRFIPFGNPTATPDNREGWWCATDFQLRRIPLLRVNVDASGWGTICLPAQFTVPEGVTLYEALGILANGTAIALNPVTEPQAGYPYLFHTEATNTTVQFVEQGDDDASDETVNGFMGFLTTTAALSYPLNSFRLDNGRFVKVEERGIHIPSFSVMIYKENQLPVLSSFNGVTIPIVGASSGIESLQSEQAAESPAYNLQGQRITPSTPGLVVNGKRVLFVK